MSLHWSEVSLALQYHCSSGRPDEFGPSRSLRQRPLSPDFNKTVPFGPALRAHSLDGSEAVHHHCWTEPPAFVENPATSMHRSAAAFTTLVTTPTAGIAAVGLASGTLKRALGTVRYTTYASS